MSRRLSPCCLFLTVALLLATFPFKAVELFSDTFDDGIIDPRYSVFGGATMVEQGGKLKVAMFEDSGLIINVSDLADMACFSLEFDIPLSTWAPEDTMQATIVATSGVTGQQFNAVEFLLQRVFWNRCRYLVTQKDGNKVKVGFWGSHNTDVPCPDAGKVRFDWLSGDRFWIEIDGMELDLRMIREKGDTLQVGDVDTRFKHENDRIDFIEIKKLSNEEAEGKNQKKDYVLELDTLTIDSEHPGLRSQAVMLAPSSFFDRGEVRTITVTTEDPILVRGVSTLDMGSDVLIHSFRVLSPTRANARIEIDRRAANGGHAIIVETRQGSQRSGLMGEFNINPIGPIEPIPNVEPAVQLRAPTSVTANIPFSVTALFDDVDDAFVRGVVVIMETVTGTELFGSGDFFVDTSGARPVVKDFDISGLPAGQYQVIAVADDGLAGAVVVESTLIAR